jgi:methylmalonyl-CoA mutase C-terminal domain/subunit
MNNMAIRFLLGKIGVDGHDRGIRTLSYELRRSGFEVIYTGPYQTIDAIADAAIQEDVQIIGISTLAGDYVLIPKLMKRLKEREIEVPVILGGTIPNDLEDSLRKAGIKAIFRPGAKIEDIIDTIRSLVAK